MQCRTVVVVTSRHRMVRRTYAARTQCILLDTPMVKIIRHSIEADTLWVRKVRYGYAVASLHTPHIRDRYSYRIAIHYHEIEQRTRYVRAALFRSYGVRVTYVRRIEAGTNVWRFFQTCLK